MQLRLEWFGISEEQPGAHAATWPRLQLIEGLGSRGRDIAYSGILKQPPKNLNFILGNGPPIHVHYCSNFVIVDNAFHLG
ncbi:MAG: hypothetical protein ABI972_30545 [Acidobacteriota bacterium]